MQFYSLFCGTCLFLLGVQIAAVAHGQNRAISVRTDRNPSSFYVNEIPEDGVTGLLQISADGRKLLVGENSIHGPATLRLIDTSTRKSKVVSRSARIALEDETTFEANGPWGYQLSPAGTHAFLLGLDATGWKRAFLLDLSPRPVALPLDLESWLSEHGAVTREFEIKSARFTNAGDRLFLVADFIEEVNGLGSFRVLSLFEYTLRTRAYRRITQSEEHPLLATMDSVDAVSSDSEFVLVHTRQYHPERKESFVSIATYDGATRLLYERKTDGWPLLQGLSVTNNGERAVIHSQSTVDLEQSSATIYRSQILEIGGDTKLRPLDCDSMYGTSDMSPSSNFDGSLIAMSSQPYSVREGAPSKAFIRLLNLKTRKCRNLTGVGSVNEDTAVSLTVSGKKAAYLQVVRTSADNYLRKSLILIPHMQ